MSSITFKSFIDEHGIEIPIIQRDYVQGRGVSIIEQDKREAFVDKLLNALAKEDVSCHLEFIYGVVNETSRCFVPLDGQQRLTTLFLLHWVLWQKSSKEVQQTYPLSGWRFRYLTRLSSLSFCENLVKHLDLLPVPEAMTMGAQLQNQPWFAESWNNDPTIVAMISMIDFMAEKLRSFEESDVSAMLIKLLNTDTITFDELNMSEYNLSDALYIKMNARGKQLSPFENWKAEFIRFLEQKLETDTYKGADCTRKAKSDTYKDYFSHSIEHEWIDLFWNYLKDDYLSKDINQRQESYPCIDKMFMNFFDALCLYCYYVQNTSKNEKQEITSFSKLKANEKREIWQNKEFVDFLFSSLDALCKIGNNHFFDSLFYICETEMPSGNDECKVRLFRTEQTNLFKICVDKGASMELTDILLFHALLYYCIRNNVTFVDSRLKSYMRNVRNYYESTIQNLRNRTTVQLNLRVSEFGKYDSDMQQILASTIAEPMVPMEDRLIIEDCSIIRGNMDVFEDSIKKYGNDKVKKALSAFCQASTVKRIRTLVSCGYQGAYLGDCIGRSRYFFGKKDRWDVLFISDAKQLSECFVRFTGKISEGKDIPSVIKEARTSHIKGFVYYMLNYDEFLKANKSYHYAVKGELDDVDWIALGSYSSNPGSAYHADPFACAVEKIIMDRHPNMALSLWKQYSGKCPLSLVKDKKEWIPYFSVISRHDGWHVMEGSQYLSEDIKKDLCIEKISDSDFRVPQSPHKDMIQTCVDLIERVFDAYDHLHLR